MCGKKITFYIFHGYYYSTIKNDVQTNERPLLSVLTQPLFLDCEKIYVGNLEGVRQLILGSVYSNAGKLDVAKQCYIKAMKAGEATDDVHTSAFAAYELGMALSRKPEVCISAK